MPNNPNSTTQTPDTVHRTVRLRLFPGHAATGILLTAMAGACRYVWNHMLADCEFRYARWKEMHVPALNWTEVRAGRTARAKAVRKKMGPGPGPPGQGAPGGFARGRSLVPHPLHRRVRPSPALRFAAAARTVPAATRRGAHLRQSPGTRPFPLPRDAGTRGGLGRAQLRGHRGGETHPPSLLWIHAGTYTEYQGDAMDFPTDFGFTATAIHDQKKWRDVRTGYC